MLAYIVTGMNDNETLGSAMGQPPINSMADALSQNAHKAAEYRWNPRLRHDSAMQKIERIVTQALKHPDVKFTRDDRARVVELMGGRVKKPSTSAQSPKSAHE
jgi:hypothetical protein